ncbi:MAG: Omp28-related outer membrane protein [Paludibacteraceae bacterium]|nr:Omp28-related outer membrane protein [Paludibacteraceae bacterium]
MKKCILLLCVAVTLFGLAGCEPAVLTPTVAIEPDTVNLFIGQKDTLEAVITPEETVVDIMIWETSNSKIAAVNTDGVISAKSEGQAIITLTTGIGTAQCVVNVESGTLTIDQESTTCNVFETIQLNVTRPEHKAEARVSWKSSNSAVASVDSKGNVTGMSAGEAVITASVTGCKSVQCTVKVNDVPLIYDRKHLIEHFTGDQCGYCPYGMYSIVDYLETAKTPTIWVSHHAGYNQDEFTIDESRKLVSALGVSGAPNMAMNRSKQEPGLIFHPGYLPEITIKDKNKAAVSVNIKHSYDAASRKMDITVSGESSFATDGKFLLSVLVKENRLVGKQADYYYAWGDYMWKEFMHARVVRGMLTPAMGDTIVMNNQAYSKTYSYTIPAGWVAENCCVVAYVTPVSNQPVINAEQVVLVEGTTGGEEYNPYGITESKGPSSKIAFQQAQVNKVEGEDLLEVLLISNTKVSTAYGDAQPVATIYVHTDATTLSAGTYPIKEDGSMGSIQAGYRIDEKASFGGSLLVYAHSEYLSNGQIASTHIWRMLGGEMVVDAQGNISLNIKTCSGTTVNGTYTASGASLVAKKNLSSQVMIMKDHGVKVNKEIQTK